MWLWALLACTAEDPERIEVWQDRLYRLEVEMNPDDEQELRLQSRSLVDALGPGCTDTMAVSPFTWFEGDFSLDGERMERVGVRKKGFLGSLSSDRPSLKIKTDVFEEGQRFHGEERLTFNNNNQDPSRIRTCLAYAYFEDAGVPAPRCNFAEVALNGDELGIYSHVEAVKKDFLRRHFGSDEGDLFEGTLSDFREGWLGSFEPKTSASDPERKALHILAEALTAPDDQLLQALEPILDVDEFVRFWAAETIVGHWDGYSGNTNNFFVYWDPTDGKLHFIPWGPDGTFQRDESEGTYTPFLAEGWLTKRLYGTTWGRQAYLDELQRQLDEVWDTDRMLDRIDAWTDQVGTDVLDPDAFDAEIQLLRELVRGRRDLFQVGLDEGGYDLWLEPREPLCFEPDGEIEVSFDANWGTLGAEDVFEFGDSSWAGTRANEPMPSMFATSALAGIDEEGNYTIGVYGLWNSFDHVDVLVILVEPSLFEPREVSLSLTGGLAFYVSFNTEDFENPEYFGLVDGVLVLDEAGTVEGDPVRGTVTGVTLETWF